jgi:hypothetical protein
MALAILATPSFARMAKQLHSQDKAAPDAAVQAAANDPALGEEKRGDLSGVFVHKFKINKQDEGEQAGGMGHDADSKMVELTRDCGGVCACARCNCSLLRD